MFTEFKSPIPTPRNFWENFKWIGESHRGAQGQVSDTCGKIIYHSHVYQALDNIGPFEIDGSVIYICKGTFVVIETTWMNDELHDDEAITGIGDVSLELGWLIDIKEFKDYLKSETAPFKPLPTLNEMDI